MAANKDTDWFEIAKHLMVHRPPAAETITGATIFAMEGNPDYPWDACALGAQAGMQHLLADLHEFAHSGVSLDDLVCEIDQLFLEVHR